jgi:hypothetical protein
MCARVSRSDAIIVLTKSPLTDGCVSSDIFFGSLVKLDFRGFLAAQTNSFFLIILSLGGVLAKRSADIT